MQSIDGKAAMDIRARPSEAFIDEIRARFPTESEIDLVLTSKMRRRNGTSFQAVSLETLVSGTLALINHRLGYEVEISAPRWLSGGASKLQMVFNLHWRGDDGTAPSTIAPMVLRMEPLASVTESSRRREYEILRAVEGIMPVPRAHWVDPVAEFLPYPAMVMGFVSGMPKPTRDSGKVTGLGQNYGPELRAKLGPRFVDLLVRLHSVDVARVLPQLRSFDPPQVGTNASVIRQVNSMRRVWEEDRLEEEPVMAIVYKWLIKNAPELDHLSIVHGDYRSGNFLFDEERAEITAWLDWESAALGDRHQDLTYATLPLFQHYAEDGITALASGMMPANELYASYARMGNLPVDPKRIRYFSVYNRYLAVVLALAVSARVALGRASHQDVLLNHISAMGYPALAELSDYFRKVTT